MNNVQLWESVMLAVLPSMLAEKGAVERAALVADHVVAVRQRRTESVTVSPKLVAAIEQLNHARAAEGLHSLPRHKAAAQLAAQRIIEFTTAHGMEATPAALEMIAQLILEPVVEDNAEVPHGL
jgi:hypothetical protein